MKYYILAVVVSVVWVGVLVTRQAALAQTPATAVASPLASSTMLHPFRRRRLRLRSVAGRPIDVYETNYRDRPGVLLVGQVHGDETPGYAVAHHFMAHAHSPWASAFNVYVIPTLNPDNNNIERHNRNGKDLNRDFDDLSQPETEAFADFVASHPDIVLGLTFHSGAAVTCYPFDRSYDADADAANQRTENTRESRSSRQMMGTYAASFDDTLYKRISKAYADNHGKGVDRPHEKPMYLSTKFRGGVCNGAHWYPIRGSLGDFCYRKHGMLSLTVEVSQPKNPAYAEQMGPENMASIISTVKETMAHTITGKVVRADGTAATGSRVWIQGCDIPVRTRHRTATFCRPCESDAVFTLHATAEGQGQRSEPVVARPGAFVTLTLPEERHHADPHDASHANPQTDPRV